VALKRELAAAVAIPIVLAVVFFLPPLAFHLLVATVTLGALWEFYRLAERTGHPVAKTVGMLAGALVFAAAVVRWSSMSSRTPSGLLGALPVEAIPAGELLLVLAAVFLASVAPLLASVPPASSLAGAGSTVIGVLSVPLPATALCFLRFCSPRAVLLLFLLVWGCDSFAYYVGKSLGRRKLAPIASPNKTWEGAIGGLVGATLIGAAAGTWWVLPELGPARGALAGALASTAGQMGDLVESLWKRGAGVKDSGIFLPGHGGFYDRIDSLLWAGPVLALFVATLP
jgi:phosphatidate cytidylyltransferase